MMILFFAHTNQINLDDLKNYEALLQKRNAEKWERLSKYLSENCPDKTEFRIAMQNEGHFIIHPIGKDGETLDFNILGNTKK